MQETQDEIVKEDQIGDIIDSEQAVLAFNIDPLAKL